MARRGTKIEREKRTIASMIRIYCRDLHSRDEGTCAGCGELLAYAERRLEKCPFHDDKPPCADCPIHCYQRERREQIKAVMRHSGPRLFLRHPVLTLRHTLDGFRRIPDRPGKRTEGGKGSPGESADGKDSSTGPPGERDT